MNHPDSHLGATEQVRDPAPVPSGSRETGCASQPEEVAAARPATPPGGPPLFLDAQALYARAMELSGFDPEIARSIIAVEWIAAKDKVADALELCQRQARLEKSQESS